MATLSCCPVKLCYCCLAMCLKVQTDLKSLDKIVPVIGLHACVFVILTSFLHIIMITIIIIIKAASSINGAKHYMSEATFYDQGSYAEFALPGFEP